MKNIAYLFLASVFSAVLAFSACSDDDEYCIECENYDVDEAIVVELPKMYPLDFKNNETRVINTQKEFCEIYPIYSSAWYGELSKFDAKSHTLLIGRTSFGNQANLRHSFTRSEDNKFIYKIEVTGMLTKPDDFSYGIIVKKLPSKAKVVFKIEYPQEEW